MSELGSPQNSQNAWVSIWIRPKATIEGIVASNPNRSLWVLASIYGFSSLLNLFQSLSLGIFFAPLALYILAAVLSPLWGYATFALWSWVVLWIGRMFKGQGGFQEVRAAYAWSCVPFVLNIPIWVLMGMLFGEQVFLDYVDGHLFTDAQVLVLFFVFLTKIILAIWSLVIYLNALAQVERFSVLRAIGTVILSGIILAIGVTIVTVGLVKLLQMG